MDFAYKKKCFNFTASTSFKVSLAVNKSLIFDSPLRTYMLRDVSIHSDDKLCLQGFLSHKANVYKYV